MQILLTGATGFIGSRLLLELTARGHDVLCPMRNPKGHQSHSRRVQLSTLDFTKAVNESLWRPFMDGVDVVINAVGILQERGSQRFDVLHHRAPRAMFDAARAAGVRRVVQISALGADAGARSAYHRSKKAADDHLANLDLDAAIVQPSLVFAPDGASSRMFSFIARQPVIPLPGDGSQRVQPVHLEDLAQGVLALVEGAPVHAADRRIPFVGPVPMTLRAYYEHLRAAQGRGTRATFVPIPRPLISAAAALGSHIPGVLLDRDTWGMLERGNTGDPGPLTRLLGHSPRAVERFFD